MPSTIFDLNLLPDLLTMYYNRLFPYSKYYKWLSYGNVSSTYFCNREFSFTLADDIYLRYQSFKDEEDLEREIKRRCPHKIDIGAVYSFRPKDRRTVSVFTPQEKELVFDIDMTDYDEVRYCCSGAEICNKCWKYMTIAVKVLDRSLRDDFGFKHMLWVYSGRRGVHCWVCDAKARALSQSERTALAEYLQVIRGGDNQAKKVHISSASVHPHLMRSEEIALDYFESLCLEDQDMLGDAERWDKILSLIPDANVREMLSNTMPKCTNSLQRWQTIQSELSKQNKTEQKKAVCKNTLTEIVLQMVYPRLDINVSKQINHLLKSPFCIHPKTGRVCVPFPPSDADSFDPLAVPTVGQLLDEINEYDSSDDDKSVPDYKKTSLKQSMAYFDKFLHSLNKENTAIKRENNDSLMEF